MKKLLKVLLVLLAAFMIVACANETTPTQEDETPDTTETTDDTETEETDSVEGGQTYEIGVAIYQFNDNFMTLYREELQAYFEELGEEHGNTYNVEVVDGANDQARQVEQLNNFVAQGKDLIIANLVSPQGADTFLQSAKDADIPVVLINREPETTATMEIWPGKTTYVGVDARQSGRYQGEIIAGLENSGDINGDGKVSYIMIMGDTENVDAQQRTQYSIEQLEETIPTELLGARLRGDWDQTKGQELAANALAQFGDEIEVIFANNDGMGLGALTAIESAGRTVGEDIYIVSVDALEEVVNLVVAGEYTGTVLNDHFNQSHTAAEVGIMLLNGEEVAPYYWHDYVKIETAEDAELIRKDYRTETIEESNERRAQLDDKELD